MVKTERVSRVSLQKMIIIDKAHIYSWHSIRVKMFWLRNLWTTLIFSQIMMLLLCEVKILTLFNLVTQVRLLQVINSSSILLKSLIIRKSNIKFLNAATKIKKASESVIWSFAEWANFTRIWCPIQTRSPSNACYVTLHSVKRATWRSMSSYMPRSNSNYIEYNDYGNDIIIC